MTRPDAMPGAADIAAARDVALQELNALVAQVQTDQIADLVAQFELERPVYVTGFGRSGLVSEAFAMRLMHLGYHVRVAGATTTPGIGPGALLLGISNSGDSYRVRHNVRVAAEAGATTAIITAAEEVAHADHLVRLPVGPGGVPTAQHGGTLFEQAALLLGDVICEAIRAVKQPAGELLDGRHANLL